MKAARRYNSARDRVERFGPPDPLTPRFEQFLIERLGGISLDASGDKEIRPDYSCLRGILRLEIKSFLESPSHRLDNYIQPIINSPSSPKIVGDVDVRKYLGKLPNGEKLVKKLVERLGRNIRNQLKKANDQFLGYQSANFRKNVCNVVALLNEDFKEYNPESVGYIVKEVLSEKSQSGEIRNSDIHYVMFVSERHAINFRGMPAFPVLIIARDEEDLPFWKRELIDLVSERWAKWNGSHYIKSPEDNSSEFNPIDIIPDSPVNHEVWRIEYRRNPYMRMWSDPDLQSLLDAHMAVSALAFMRDSPYRFSRCEIHKVMRRFSHFLEESKDRAFIPSRNRPIELMIECLGSRLNHSQKATRVARATADRKFLASLS